MNKSQMTFNTMTRYLWLICLSVGVFGFLSIWLLLPRQAEIKSIWEIVFKIFIFFVICLGIACFPNKFKHRYILLLIPFLGFTGYIIPKISYNGFSGNVGTGEFYTLIYLLLYPGIIMTTSFAYRLGGGTPGNSLKIALGGAIILFSGYLDVMVYLVNPVAIPETLQHAQHIRVFLGHYPTYLETILFTLGHLPLLIGIVFSPLDKWGRQLLSYSQAVKLLSKAQT